MDPTPPADVVARLAAAGCVAAVEEARELLGAAPDARTLDAWIARREAGEPLAWITARVEFCGRRFHAAPGVYVPRPHTEELAHRARVLLPPGGRAIDLCTGTGVIAATLLRHVPTARVVGTDIDPRAATCARRNGVDAVVGNLADAIGGDGTWDLVTAVAPYVPTDDLRWLSSDVLAYEPGAALDGGVDGLHFVRALVVAARRLLRPGGHLLTELGAEQHEQLEPFLVAHGFYDLRPWFDEDADLRGICAGTPVT